MPTVAVSGCTSAPAWLELPPEGTATNARDAIRTATRVNDVDRIIEKRSLLPGATPIRGIRAANHKTVPVALQLVNHAIDIIEELSLNVMLITNELHVVGIIVIYVHGHDSKMFLREHLNWITQQSVRNRKGFRKVGDNATADTFHGQVRPFAGSKKCHR